LEIFNPCFFNFIGYLRTLEIIAAVSLRKKIQILSLTLLGILCYTVAPCQNNTDSLQSTLQNKLSDSVRFITYIKLSEQKQYTDFVNATLYADKAFAIADKKQWPWAKGLVYGQLSFLATLSGDYSSAMKYDNLNLQMRLEAQDSAAIAETLNFLGNDYSDLGKYDEAYYYFTQSYRIARAIDDQMKMAIAIYNIGLVLNELGQYDLALNHFNFSRDISEKIGDLDGLVYLLDATGELYLKKKEYKKSEEYLLSALKSLRERNLTIIEPRVLKRLARLKFELKDYKQSLAYYDSASVIHKKAHNEFGVAESSLGISDIYIEQQKFDEAEELIEKTLLTAKNNNAQKMKIDCFQKLSYLAEKRGDFEKGLEYHKNYKQLEDSLYSEEMLAKLFQDQIRFQTELKDSKIAALSKEKAEQDTTLKREELLRNILVVVMALTVILLFSVYRSSQRRIKINKLLIEHQQEIKKRSQELEQLNQVKDKFLSIVSHDLRSPISALSAILNLAEQKNITPEEFKQLTGELRKQFDNAHSFISNLLDWALLQMDKLKIQPAKVELATVVEENLKMVEAMQMKQIHFINEVPPGIYGLADLNMLNLILRNLMLNAIKFSEIGGKIEISCKDFDKHYTVIAVKDHGVGISEDVKKLLFDKSSGYSSRGTANEKGTGLGLILCKEFVEKNGGKIWLESEEWKGSTFYFTIQKPSE
jgi:signal transduction histidine kinase